MYQDGNDMTRDEAIDILEEHNQWRRFDGEFEDSPRMQDPKLIGEAIDIAIYELLMIEVKRLDSEK
jgi:hypothetical protein